MRLFRASALKCCSFIIASVLNPSLHGQNSGLPGQVAVEGTRLKRDGKPWTPHGFFQIAFAVPPAAFGITLPGGKPSNPAFQIAYNNYSPSEYADMRGMGADSVRMNVAEDGADPDNSYYFDREWLEKVIGAVRAARASGLTVILSIQDEDQTGAKKSDLPNEATQRVWRELAPIFKQDHGVLYELYNEPNLHPKTSPDEPPSRDDWERWATAMNKTLAVVRLVGATNVVVADGLADAQQLSGAPPLSDPLHQVAYASHPYPTGTTQQVGDYNQSRTAWDQKFGDFARTAPVIVTEWGTGYFCDEQTPQAVVNFLGYLDANNVGLEAVAWDWGPYTFASAAQGFPKPVLSSLLSPTGPSACSATSHFAPGTGHGPATAFGPGKVIENWYKTGVVPQQPE